MSYLCDVDSLKRSRDWAANTNRPLLQYLLLPRSTGLWALLKMIREDDEVKGYESYICDCTMQYSTYSGEVPDSSGEGRKHDVGIPEIATYLCPVCDFCSMNFRIRNLNVIFIILTPLSRKSFHRMLSRMKRFTNMLKNGWMIVG